MYTIACQKLYLSLKSPATERLARTLAEATGESITEAITCALEERLHRLNAAHSFNQYLEPILRVQQCIRERPVLDARTADDIIGYFVPLRGVREGRVPGRWKGKLKSSADCDAPLPTELLDAFEGGGE